MPPLFLGEAITKRYGPATVLDGVRIEIGKGEVHALLGANGAGKSTLCKIITGLVLPDQGSMTLQGTSYCPRSKQAAEARGVEIVQQELNIVGTLTIAENLFLTRLPARAGVIRKQELHARARVALDRMGLQALPPETPAHSLGIGQQQIVEIAAALDRRCRLLILDEPTAALSHRETDNLFERIDDLRRAGVSILYISHRLDEIKRIASKVSVLRDGKLVCTEDATSLSTDEMIELMSGDMYRARSSFSSHATDDVVLNVEGLSGGPVHDVHFSLRKGERLGIAGLVGSGRTELLRLIFGADRAQSGGIRLPGDTKPRVLSHPQQARSAGLAMVTEDRKVNGLLLNQSVRVNSTLNSLRKRFAWAGWIDQRKERVAVEEMAATLDVRCRHVEQWVARLSGGNQQKIAIAKWLIRDADIFFFDEPTRGIDISARRRIYQLFESLAEAGKGIVIVSSDLEELMETCDRIGVLSAGRWAGAFDRQAWSRETIMKAAFSGYTQSGVRA